MKWSVHPAKQNITKAIVVALFIIGFMVYIGIFFGAFWGVFGLIVLFLSAYSFYFPTHYEVIDEQVVIKSIFTTQRRPLKEFKKVLPGKNGVLLSPFRHKTFLNRFRGVFLFLPQNHEEIISFLREKIEEQSEEP
jgi:energy-coupling factor transporter transmembrane protein EcfT